MLIASHQALFIENYLSRKPKIRWLRFIFGLFALFCLLFAPPEAQASFDSYRANQVTFGAGAANIGGTWALAAQVSYDRRLPPMEGLLGVGAFFDCAWLSPQLYFTGPAFWLHFFNGLRLWSSFGLTHRQKLDFGIRMGASYDFFLGPIGIGPGLLIDLVNSRLGIKGEINLSLAF